MLLGTRIYTRNICCGALALASMLAIGAPAAEQDRDSNSQDPPPASSTTNEAKGQPSMQPGQDAEPRPSFRQSHRGPRDGQGHRGRVPGLWSRLSDEEREHMQAFVSEHFPRMYEELSRMRETHPERYQRRMRRLAGEMRELMALAESHPERATLIIQHRRLDLRLSMLVSRYHRTEDEAERTALRQQIRERLEESFELRHHRREMEILELEARIAELRGRHVETEEMREQFIERELKTRLDRRHWRDHKRRPDHPRGPHRPPLGTDRPNAEPIDER